MRAIVFSIGEPTTELCVWSLERQGFEVETWEDPKTDLWHKLKEFYNLPYDEVLRVDADIIPNMQVQEFVKVKCDCWWHTASGFDWYSQEIRPISIHLYRKPMLELARQNIDRYKHSRRPETRMWRLYETHNPRRCHNLNFICGLHGYKQDESNQNRVRDQKDQRAQPYDWKLFARINAL